MNHCPCCSSTLLRHIRHSQIYWYCPHCKEEMPNLGDWINTQISLNPISQQSCPAKAVGLTARNTRLNEQKSIQSWLIQDAEITPVCC